MHALILHLLYLLYSNRTDRWLLVHFYRRQQPGMPAAWYGPYVRFLVEHYPHAVSHCLTALRHGVTNPPSCP